MSPITSTKPVRVSIRCASGVNSLARVYVVWSCLASPPFHMERFEGRLVDDVFGNLTHGPHPVFPPGQWTASAREHEDYAFLVPMPVIITAKHGMQAAER